MKNFLLTVTSLLLAPAAVLHSADTAARVLPFDSTVISRLSLDGKPRSLSIRQGVNAWLGFDLERATVLKAWQAPAGKPGLIKSGFVTRSAGTTWFEDASNDKWELQRGQNIVPLTIRYLGCSQRKKHIELRWELRHDTRLLKLLERVPLNAAPAADRVVRELRVEGLAAGETLLPPAAVRKSWKLSSGQSAAPALTGTELHRLTLP
jgi:hypothetical protein